MFRSTILRIAALYTMAFALAVAALGAATVLTTRASLEQQLRARMEAESRELVQESRELSAPAFQRAVAARQSAADGLQVGLTGPRGEALVGPLAGRSPPVGWSRLVASEPGAEREAIQTFATKVGAGSLLIVGEDSDAAEELQHQVITGFAWAFAAVIALGVLGGYGYGRHVHRRLLAMSRAAEAIIDGDLGQRIPARGSGDDLDRLAATLNRMLDRIAALMDSLRQVSSDVAHDLRTPLARLRQRLDAGLTLTEPSARETAIEGALRDVDAILETFAAVLRIAQIEGGARRAAFAPVDLAELVRTVGEAFQPSVEDAGQRLLLETERPVSVIGDAELLTQLLVNLVENALRHAGAGATIRLRAARRGPAAVLAVVDDGPGVPASERARIFDRFYRLEQSRSTPGSGLGLALVAAVARLHEAQVEAFDAAPGLGVEVRFHAAAA